MSPLRFQRRLLAALCVACRLSAAASAGRFTECSLTIDGSARPPGDVITVEVAFLDDESTGVVEVRGFVVDDRTGAAQAIASRDPRWRADDGALLVKQEVRREDDGYGARAALVVPYEAIDLPDGQYAIGYQATLRIDDRVVWEQPLPVTSVRIGGSARSEICPRSIRETTQAVDEVDQIAIGSSRREGERGRVDQRSIRLRSPQEDVTAPGRVSVRVERGFERATIEQTPLSTDSRLAGLNAQPWSPADEALGENERTVRFASNRAARSAVDSDQPEFLPKRGPLQYGRCRVNFPIRFHQRGQLERPSWWQSFDSARHFRVESTNLLTAEEFLADVGPDDVLLFVHGFANRFEDGIMTTAQLAADIGFAGRSVAFCWPSAGDISQEAYLADAQMAAASVDELARLLEELTRQDRDQRRGQVHVIAHSMGNRILLEAVFRLIDSNRWQAEEQRLGQVVLAAPDVGAAAFNNLVDHILGVSRRVTYYYFDEDRALGMSQQVNKYEPVGKFPYFERNLDTINVAGSGTDFLGHSYYSSSIKVLADLELLLRYGYGPDRRMPPLGAKTRIYGHDHWSFLPLTVTEIEGGG